MAYTPELSYANSCVLRRIAWSLKEPMTVAINWSIEELAKHLDADEIRRTCNDKSRCHTCLFHSD
jgi:hypothetical protein